MSASIRTQALGVRFLFDRQNRLLTPTLARLRRRVAETWALRDVTVSFGPAEGVALLGRSGSGKTTLLRVIAGVLAPDAGTIEVRGRVASLLSLEAGLMPVLTGRENAVLLGVLAGWSRHEARAALSDIGTRTGLEEQFDRPVASYSQGMRARLGLAVVEQGHPAILLLDEVHEALDHAARAAVERDARGILDAGGIVVAAGHDHPMLERLCTHALHLERGSVVDYGEFDDVRQAYLRTAGGRGGSA